MGQYSYQERCILLFTTKSNNVSVGLLKLIVKWVKNTYFPRTPSPKLRKYTPLLMSPVGGGGGHILILTGVVFINSPGAWQI